MEKTPDPHLKKFITSHSEKLQKLSASLRKETEELITRRYIQHQKREEEISRATPGHIKGNRKDLADYQDRTENFLHEVDLDIQKAKELQDARTLANALTRRAEQKTIRRDRGERER